MVPSHTHPPTHPNTHLQQDVVSRAPEIRKDVEEAIREGSVDGLLTDGVKAVVRPCLLSVCVPRSFSPPPLFNPPTHPPTHLPLLKQRRQLQEDIIPQLASEPEQAAKMLLEEIPKLAQRSYESLPKNPKDVRIYPPTHPPTHPVTFDVYQG